MRLVDTSTLELQEFPSADHLQYAILSHTWGEGEVTFGDMSSPAARVAKRGWAKIQKTCQLAKAAGLKYAWVDTCCIDSSSSAELSESINSMFQWYAAAHVCYAYLEDLDSAVSISQGFSACRWITRGWTLQELIAPRDVRFFECDWHERGTKAHLEDTIEQCTGIPAKVLRGEQALSSVLIATKMSWAANRETTRVEDMAYSLMGLFDVNMPLLYGEGKKAFRRLQEEILRRTEDLTILWWEDKTHQETQPQPLLASHPAAFSGQMKLQSNWRHGESHSVTNRGLRLAPTLYFVKLEDGSSTFYGFPVAAVISLGQMRIAYIRLRKLNGNTFCRVGRLFLGPMVEESRRRSYTAQDSYYFLLDVPIEAPVGTFRPSARFLAIHIPLSTQLIHVSPHYYWDMEDRVFLQPIGHSEKPMLVVYAAQVAVPVRGELVELVVLLQRQWDGRPPWRCRIYDPKAYPRFTQWIFSPKWEFESLYWADLTFHVPELLEAATDTIVISVGVGKVFIKASLKLEKATVTSGSEMMYVLHFVESAIQGPLAYD